MFCHFIFDVVVNLRQDSQSEDWIPISAVLAELCDGGQNQLPL